MHVVVARGGGRALSELGCDADEITLAGCQRTRSVRYVLAQMYSALAHMTTLYMIELSTQPAARSRSLLLSCLTLEIASSDYSNIYIYMCV